MRKLTNRSLCLWKETISPYLAVGGIFTRCVCDPLWPRFLCPCDSPGKNTGVSCYFLLQGIFPPQGLNPHLLGLLHCGRFFTTVPSGKPILPDEVMLKWGFGYYSLISVLQSRQNSRYARKEEAKDDSTFYLIRPGADICYLLFFKVSVEEIFDHIDIPVKLKSVKRSLFIDENEKTGRERWRTIREETFNHKDNELGKNK